jgi:hypothetical protein
MCLFWKYVLLFCFYENMIWCYSYFGLVIDNLALDFKYFRCLLFYVWDVMYSAFKILWGDIYKIFSLLSSSKPLITSIGSNETDD